MRGNLFKFNFVLGILIGPSVVCASGVETENIIREQRVREAMQYSARVVSTTANVFKPSVMEGHGTTFIVSLTETEGIVFTNRHVIQKGPLDARKIEIEFPIADGAPETIEAEVEFIDDGFDFATLKFDPRKLKRGRENLRVATLDDSSIVQGRAVMAFGYPHEGDKISNFGSITGISQSVFNSKNYISIDAAINPGNSGGPLIDVENGKVIGINTAKIDGAEGMGYTIPIGPLLKNWKKYREDPKHYGKKTYNYMYLFDLSDEHIEARGLTALIEKSIPDYFDKYSSILQINYVPKISPLRPGDLLLTINGETVGDRRDFVDSTASSTTGTSALFKVIRDGEVKEIPVPIINTAPFRRRSSHDFILISGLLIQAMTLKEQDVLNDGKPGLIFKMILPNSPAATAPIIASSDILKEVQSNTRRSKVSTLKELREFLTDVKLDDILQLVFLSSVRHGDGVISSPLTKIPLYHHITVTDLLPITYIVTPQELSLADFKKSFDFSGLRPKQTDWRHQLRAASCSNSLKSLDRESKL